MVYIFSQMHAPFSLSEVEGDKSFKYNTNTIVFLCNTLVLRVGPRKMKFKT